MRYVKKLFCKIAGLQYMNFYNDNSFLTSTSLFILLPLLKHFQILLEHIGKLSHMYAIHKRMMRLNRYGHDNSAVLLIIFSPVEQRRRIILFPGIGMWNMRIGDPRHRRTLKYVISQGTGKIFLLFPGSFSAVSTYSWMLPKSGTFTTLNNSVSWFR